MATFRRRSRRRPLHRDGFYSFVEDWDRSDGAEGHLRMRAATFRGAAVRTGKSRCGTSHTFKHLMQEQVRDTTTSSHSTYNRGTAECNFCTQKKVKLSHKQTNIKVS